MSSRQSKASHHPKTATKNEDEPLATASPSRRHLVNYSALLIELGSVECDPVKSTGQPPRWATRFDFEIGKWGTHLWGLEHPLSQSNSWVEYWGTTEVRKVWNGRANLVERLNNPQSHQWSLNFASSAGGSMSPPTIGAFKDGRGEFYDQETFNGRAILVRLVISDIKPDSCRFEQTFSEDDGKTWEVNWIAIDSRVDH